MGSKFHSGIQEIVASKKPITTAWELSVKHHNLDSKILKVIEILSDHENLFITKNPYHSRQHLAEVIWASSYLLKKEMPNLLGPVLFDSMMIMLLASTFHDAEHTGRSNKVPFEVEEISTKFFKAWWRNNSLFVENIVSLTPIQVEQIVSDMILFTDFTSGHDKVLLDYNTRRDIEAFGIQINRLKKILVEADFLLNCLPQYAFDKTSLILQESVRQIPEKDRWLLIMKMLAEADGMFTSDASKELKIDSSIRKFYKFLSENKDLMVNTEKMQNALLEKFKNNI